MREISPADAARPSIQEDKHLLTSSERERIEVPAQISHALLPGHLFLFTRCGENPVNVLTSAEASDSLAKIAERKGTKARVE